MDSKQTKEQIKAMESKAKEFDESIQYMGRVINNPNLQNLCHISQQLTHKKNFRGFVSLGKHKANKLSQVAIPCNSESIMNKHSLANMKYNQQGEFAYSTTISKSLKYQTMSNTSSTILQLHRSMGRRPSEDPRRDNHKMKNHFPSIE